MALNDEGQQYGNMDEASAIARAPRKCLVIWCGDHKQTPGPYPFGSSPLAQVAVSVQARVGLGLILLQERRFPVSVFFLSDWSERKGLSFISLLGFDFEQERHLPVVEYWCERLRSFTSVLLEILVWIERKKGFLSTSGPFSEIL